MKFVVAPDSYKGSLTAREACEAMEKGIRKVVPDANVIKVPMADGGEGTVQSLVDATGGRILTHAVTNPIGEKVTAKYGILGDGETAVIEMAEASGLYLVPKDRRNPLHTTTFGTGELIRAALDHGCRKFILGIGGSATNDGGIGMAQALGVKFLDDSGTDLPFGGGSLGQLSRIDLAGIDPRLKECTFTVACDVDNPLTGPQGASHVFGPQKGATPDMIQILDQNLLHYSQIIERDLGKSIRELPGAGAAGGLGAGMVAFLGAVLKRGVDIVIEATGIEEKVAGADLVFSGEGQVDFQTERGKTPFGVAKVAQRAGVPVILVAGSIGEGVEILYQHGVQSVFSMVNRPMTLEEAMENAHVLLEAAIERIVRAKFHNYKD
ncbi:glycerate kinase [Effusibacillus lacus]|uniref:Glycerate kinase n=1 Tax=Effusibacillus lacus TaxID=1348429 RepID=A0A292YCT5_9BACL|nr:glycerate kinase [Effusibacillus lacus]TCS73606.1 glycerate kinase [Effusibacillus lacus]GAX89502.1 glycerate kinase [Effusibacillus lacus]